MVWVGESGRNTCVCVCVCVYIYMYTYIYTYMGSWDVVRSDLSCIMCECVCLCVCVGSWDVVR